MQLTEEQTLAATAARDGGSLKIAAFAGTGKTYTLHAVARSLREGKRSRVLYLTFNKRLADEARGKFRGLAQAMTCHALAFRHVGRLYKKAGRLKGSVFSARAWLEKQLDLEPLQEWGYPRQDAPFPILATIENFTRSASSQITSEHIPDTLQWGVSGSDKSRFLDLLTSLAQRGWEKMIAPDSQSPITHDTYLKLFQLQGNHDIGYDTILFDEAQDANPTMIDILRRQDVQIVVVGDRHQQIYAWRGAINAMKEDWGNECALTQSWRFGHEIADLATQILQGLKGESRRVLGNPGIESRVVSSEPSWWPNAILTRSNVGALREVIRLIDQGRRVAVVGEVLDLTECLRAAHRLWNGEPARHPEFSSFPDWERFTRLVNQFPELAGQYGPYIRMMEEYGNEVPQICSSIDRGVVGENQNPDVLVSTVHRAKGREWDRVVLGEDFAYVSLVFGLPERVVVNDDEANLAYVAVTRAKKDLYLGGLGENLDKAIRLVRSLREEERQGASQRDRALNRLDMKRRGVRSRRKSPHSWIYQLMREVFR